MLLLTLGLQEKIMLWQKVYVKPKCVSRQDLRI